MKEHKTALLHDVNPKMFTTTEKQREYLNECTYNLISPGGRNYQRTMELIAYNALSGNALVKEKVSFSGNGYEKVYVLSEAGKPEKHKGESFQDCC